MALCGLQQTWLALPLMLSLWLIKRYLPELVQAACDVYTSQPHGFLLWLLSLCVNLPVRGTRVCTFTHLHQPPGEV